MEHTPYDGTSVLQDPDPLYIQTTAAVGKTLLKGLPRMDKVKMRLFFVMLEHINWREYADSIIIIDNQLAKKRLGWNIQNDAAVAKRVRDGFKSMITECMITVQTDGDTKKKIPLFLGVYGNTRYTAVAVNPVFMYQMSNLPAYGGQYFQFDIEDIMSFRSQYSIYLCMELRSRQKYKRQYNGRDKTLTPRRTNLQFSTKTLKDIMGLDRERYTSPKIEKDADGNGYKKDHFDRSNFEKDVLAKSLEEISHSRMIDLHHPSGYVEKVDWIKRVDALWYSKEKHNGRVKYYHIRFCVREELFDTVYGRHINNARLNEIAQGFASGSEKKEYRAWLDGIRQASVQEIKIHSGAGDADIEKL